MISPYKNANTVRLQKSINVSVTSFMYLRSVFSFWYMHTTRISLQNQDSDSYDDFDSVCMYVKVSIFVNRE